MRTKEDIREYQRQWRARNPDKCHGYTMKWRAKNFKAFASYARQWARDNREKRNEIELRYKAKNPEKLRAKAHRRRERLRNVRSSDIKSANILCQLISNPSRLKCGICGKNMPKNDRTVDHIIPVAKGGSGEIWNLRIVHLSCNSMKGAKLPHEFSNQHEFSYD